MLESSNLTEKQAAAALAIDLWLDGGISPTFVLSGYAGTGKTYLIRNAVCDYYGDSSMKDVAFVTPTGKAASVLIQRGVSASTIHHLIYSVVEKEISKVVGGETITTKVKRFMKKPKLDRDYRLIVLDEVSMVDEKIMEDLMSYNIPILCSGDPGQLPPICGSNSLLTNPDFQLTDIIRQESGNSILTIAEKARKGIPFGYGDYGNVNVLDKSKMTSKQLSDILMSADQILCGKNSTRRKINAYVRKIKGIDVKEHPEPQIGEKVIFGVNDWSIFMDEGHKYNIVNGTMGYVSEYEDVSLDNRIAMVSFSPDFLPHNQVCGIAVDSGIFNDGKFRYGNHQIIYKMPDGRYIPKPEIDARRKDENILQYYKRIGFSLRDSYDAEDELLLNEMEYGYCISVHKSQGSEWDNIVLIDESNAFAKDRSKWLYTGITRAKKTLTIIR